MTYILHPTGARMEDPEAEDFGPDLEAAQARWDELRAAGKRQAWIEAVPA